MITFKEDSFVIEVKTGIDPACAWVETYKEIIDILRVMNPEMQPRDNYYYLLCLLEAMLPNEKQAMKLM